MLFIDYIANFKEDKWRCSAWDGRERKNYARAQELKNRICGENAELKKLFDSYESEMILHVEDETFYLCDKYLCEGVKIGMELQRAFAESDID